MVYKQTLIPDKKNHTIEMPEEFFGKKIEVIMIELNGAGKEKRPSPPPGKKIAVSELFENFGKVPDFPSIDEIRETAWPSKW